MINFHNKRFINKFILFFSVFLITAVTSVCEAAAPADITYKSSTSAPYSSAQLEYTKAGTYTWTVPAGVDQIKVTTVGGGGSGI